MKREFVKKKWRVRMDRLERDAARASTLASEATAAAAEERDRARGAEGQLFRITELLRAVVKASILTYPKCIDPRGPFPVREILQGGYDQKRLERLTRKIDFRSDVQLRYVFEEFPQLKHLLRLEAAFADSGPRVDCCIRLDEFVLRHVDRLVMQDIILSQFVPFFDAVIARLNGRSG